MADHASHPWCIFQDCVHWGNHQKLSNNFCNAWKAFFSTNIQAHHTEAYVNSYVDLRLLLYCGRTSHTACLAVAAEATIFNPEEMVSFLHGFEQGEEEGGGGGGDVLWSGPAWLI